MQIRQIQVANNVLEDRLHIRIATQDNEEIGVFITRRFLRELWPYLMTILLDRFSAAPTTMADEKSQAKGSAPSFDQAFDNENPLFPLGENPLLASEVNLEMSGTNAVKITFREGQERNISLSLDSDLMHAFCSMLRSSSDKAGWDLQLDYAKQRPAAAFSIPSTSRGILH
ncbi:MAG: hypothetical protein RIR18_1362 [Pseudomonadota bacterium]|jgi:hypothetical protein